ncbi:hypothetical protein BC6_00002 [Bacillus phage BC-6]|nr:hypothetical protein BC6_00002 [Bacillus phage BC-6]
MKAIYLKGKFYLLLVDDAFGIFGQEIPAEAYDSLNDILDEDKLKHMGELLKGTEFVDELGYLK